MAENSTKNKQCDFLPNQPLGKDLFLNQSQEKIASVISEKIINENNFKIIGIDGEWGSGKSNLVKLLQNKLSNSHQFFIYDVWGHQEDEQRKSILVELTDFIKNQKGLLKNNKKEHWDKELKVLLAKSKETTTINQPYLSIGFIFSLLSIVYVPSINVFKDSIVDFFEIKALFWKLLLVLFPIFIVIGIYLGNLVKYWCDRNGFWKSFKLSAQETFQVYTNKQKEETKIETISEDEPSVREFRKWMSDIDNDLAKPIIIVFDNFDRLPKKHILSIWSSIHIFFSENPYKNIKVIIPFDREHIQNAFKEHNGENNKNFGDDYVNKTFDIVFRVTQPIMSNWKKFLEEQWEKAFTSINEEELKYVIQVYEFLHRRVTPREIISFINEILTIKLLNDDFKERYIAVFVLRKDEILKNPLKAVTDFKDILGGLHYIYANDTAYAQQLTAIIYHIDVNNALELIYSQQLKEAMMKNDVSLFNNICKADFINAWFYSTILTLDTFENPILTLNQIAEDTKVDSIHIKNTWDLLYKKALDAGINNILKLEDWQIALLQHILDNQYLSKLLEKNVDIINNTDIHKYIDLVDDLIKYLDEERVLNNLVERKTDEYRYIKLMEYKGEDYEKYKLSTDYNKLDKYLSELDVNEILKLKNTYLLPKNFEFKEYKNELTSILKGTNDIQIVNDILIKIKEISYNSADLRDLLDNNKIGSLYANNQNSELPIISELIAMCIAKGNNFNTSYNNYFSSILNTENEKLVEQIANTILNYITYGDLLLLSEYFKSYLLFKQIIVKMFDKNIVKRVNINNLINNYSQIKASLGINDNLLLKELNKWKINKDEIDLYNLNHEFIDDCLANQDLRITKDFLNIFNEDFKNFDKDFYEVTFDDERNIHFKYFEYIAPTNLTQESLDIFGNKFIELLKEEIIIEEQRWNILKIYDDNHSNISVVNMFKDILDNILISKIVLKVDNCYILSNIIY